MDLQCSTREGTPAPATPARSANLDQTGSGVPERASEIPGGQCFASVAEHATRMHRLSVRDPYFAEIQFFDR